MFGEKPRFWKFLGFLAGLVANNRDYRCFIFMTRLIELIARMLIIVTNLGTNNRNCN